MKDLRLEIEDGTVLIIDNKGNTIYRIRKPELPRTIEGNLSEWIMQLMEKTWISTRLLYQLALIIKKEFPHNSIDWYKTFFIVEKANYLTSLGDVLMTKKESITANVFEEIEFGRKETSEETHQIISTIVHKRFEEFKLD